jgi:hypothetical protein
MTDVFFFQFVKALRSAGVKEANLQNWRDEIDPDDARMSHLLVLEKRAKEEAGANMRDMRTFMGESVRYGMPVQLRHGRIFAWLQHN